MAERDAATADEEIVDVVIADDLGSWAKLAAAVVVVVGVFAAAGVAVGMANKETHC